jgi:ubiquinone/menaquinone biosynthesis C-methylase UbiE
MASEFDQYVSNYRDIINQNAAITGENFEYFIGLRLGLVQRALEKSGHPEPRRILDFGCGVGATETQLRARFPSSRLDGIDDSKESLKAAESLAIPNAQFHDWKGERLPFDDASFDLIYSNGTFHHIPHERHPAIFRELVRVLKPGGDAFIFENNPLNPLMVRGMRNNPFDKGTKMLFPWYLRSSMAVAGLNTASPYFYVFFPKQLKALRFAEPRLRRLPLGAQYFVRGTRR